MLYHMNDYISERSFQKLLASSFEISVFILDLFVEQRSIRTAGRREFRPRE